MANRRKLTQEQIDSIPRRHANGQSDQEIADEFGVSSMTIYRYRNQDYYERHRHAAKEYQRGRLEQVQQRRKSSHDIFSFAFHRDNDAAVIEKLRSVDNTQDYIRQLILADIQASDGSSGAPDAE